MWLVDINQYVQGEKEPFKKFKAYSIRKETSISFVKDYIDNNEMAEDHFLDIHIMFEDIDENESPKES